MGNISKTSNMCFEVSNIQTNNHSIVFGIIESLLRPIRRILVQVPSSAFEMLCSAGGSCSFVGSPPLATLSRSRPRHVCQKKNRIKRTQVPSNSEEYEFHTENLQVNVHMFSAAYILYYSIQLWNEYPLTAKLLSLGHWIRANIRQRKWVNDKLPSIDEKGTWL